ncbi:hypothetical protein [Thalassobacillus pellis]|uniref:hypothetical protein n=1 Tax=Thalassobacillus pellis TaxID=748008 RepID=UPI0019608CB6|nr:hypothetical protein [Thalassobacillus pellis]MBM7553918.1 hypothetical protein [Thalassobacillus pellis]
MAYNRKVSTLSVIGSLIPLSILIYFYIQLLEVDNIFITIGATLLLIFGIYMFIKDFVLLIKKKV